MTTYYFDLTLEGEATSIDEEGVEMPDLDAARIEAATMLCDLARGMISQKQFSNVTVMVRDDFGDVLRATFDFQIRRVN